MKIKLLSLIGGFLLGCLILSSCTGNQRAKYFGGNYTIKLPENKTLVTATWKGWGNPFKL